MSKTDRLSQSVGWIAGGIVAIFLYFLLFPMHGYGHSKDSARQSGALSNAKHLAVGLVLYAEDWETFPATHQWDIAIETYVRRPDAFLDYTIKPRSDYGFAFYNRLGNVNPKNVENPERAPLIFQTDLQRKGATGNLSILPTMPRGRHGRDIIAFVDTSARFVDRNFEMTLRLNKSN